MSARHQLRLSSFEDHLRASSAGAPEPAARAFVRLAPAVTARASVTPTIRPASTRCKSRSYIADKKSQMDPDATASHDVSAGDPR